MLQEIFPHYCERFSFFLIKCGNDGRMLWAAAVPMILLLLSRASSQLTSADPSVQQGEPEGDAARAGCSSGGVWLPTVGQATTSSKLTVLRRSTLIINVFLIFFFSAALEISLWKCKCCDNSSVQADENV